MSNLIPFSYQGRQVRTIVINGETHFVAKDICDILEIGDTSKAVSRLSDQMKGTNSIPTLGGSQEMLTVTEAGVYKLVFSSRKPEAEQFTDWIATDVLPSIRKTGGYMVLPKSLPEALRAYADEVETRMLAEAKVKELQPKADFFDAVADSKTAIDMAVAAKVLEIPGVGRNKLFEELRRHRVLDQYNRPFQEYVDRGYFRVIEQKYAKPDGSTHINIKTLVYQKGLDYIRRVLTIKKAG